MKTNILPGYWRSAAIPFVLLAVLAITVVAGCGNDSAAGALNPANDPKLFDHNRPQSADDKAKMEAYMQSHRTQGPPAGSANGPGAHPSVFKP